MFKSIIKKILANLPFKTRLVQFGALLPRKFKSQFTVRVFGNLLTFINPQTEIATNLGISDQLRVRLKVESIVPVYLFGQPSIYKGERGPLFLASHFARSCEWFVDIGANVGYYTYFIKSTSNDTKIASFEPNRELFDSIRSTINNNHLNGISINCLGVSDRRGKSEFYLDRNNHTMGSLLSNFGNTHDLEKCSIEVTDFDSFASDNDISGNAVIKVDVENAEHLFVDGARETLKTLRYLIIELLYPARQAKILERLISEFGFYAYYINDHCLENMEYEDLRYVGGEMNWLFCRENPSQLQAELTGSGFSVVDAPIERGIDLNHQPYVPVTD